MRETDVGCPYKVLFKIWVKDLEFKDDLLGSNFIKFDLRFGLRI